MSNDRVVTARARGQLILFVATAGLGFANAIRQFAENNSNVDRPLGLLSLAVAVASMGAAWATWRATRWRFRLVVLWATVMICASVAGSILLRTFLPRARDLVPGPVVVSLIAALVVWRVHRQLRASEDAKHIR